MAGVECVCLVMVPMCVGASVMIVGVCGMSAAACMKCVAGCEGVLGV